MFTDSNSLIEEEKEKEGEKEDLEIECSGKK